MFAIYDTQGRRFRDTLENLRKVQAPAQSASARPGASSVDTPPGKSIDQDVPTDAKSNDRAVRAYRQTRNLGSRERIYHAHQIMTHPVSTLRMDIDIANAWAHFRERDVRQVPVLDAQNAIVGMLSLEDLLKFVILDGTHVQILRGKAVKDAMSHEVITADPITDIRRIAQLMQEYRLHAVPIVDELDKLVGIVSRTDLLRTLSNNPPLSLWT